MTGWQPTYAHLWAVAVELTLLVAGVVIGRPDAVVIAAPLVLVVHRFDDRTGGGSGSFWTALRARAREAAACFAERSEAACDGRSSRPRWYGASLVAVVPSVRSAHTPHTHDA